MEELKNYVPESAYGYVRSLLHAYPIHFRISRPRKTKLGDYRYDPRSRVHSISVNGDLNQYAFLITLIHELAHYRQHTNNRRQTAPHGNEWKSEFHALMTPLIKENIFPQEIADHLSHHMQNPKASCSDIKLMRLLESYDQIQFTRLEDLSDGDHFTISGKKTFRRDERLRTRYRCTEVATNRKWYVHALTKVEIVN